MARRCWKHSRQKTGRPWVDGRHRGFLSALGAIGFGLGTHRRVAAASTAAAPSARLALQALQRLGSFLKPLSAKNICSPQ